MLSLFKRMLFSSLPVYVQAIDKLSAFMFKLFDILLSIRLIICPHCVYKSTPQRIAISDRPIKVCFLLEYAGSWDCFDSVWRAMMDDKNYIVKVVVASGRKRLYGNRYALDGPLIDNEVPFVNENYFSIGHFQPDVVIYHIPYNRNHSRRFRFNQIHRQCPRLVYIPYGFEIASADSRAGTQYQQYIQKYSWMVCARSSLFKKMYGKYCPAGNDHVVVTGHPMVDAVLKSSDYKANTAGMAEKIRGRKAILWNPHYSVSKLNNDCSTYWIWKDSIFKFFDDNQGLFLIFRPHPGLFERILCEGLMTAKEVADLIKYLEGSENIFYDSLVDHKISFSLSSGLISDASSFLTLYAVTGKPVMYLPNLNGVQLNEAGDIASEFYIGKDEISIYNFIGMVGREEDPMFEPRMQCVQRNIYMPEEDAGHLIKNIILERIRRGE